MAVAWNVSLRYGSQLAAIVPFSGCCTWSNFDWNDMNAEDTVLKELEHLFICSYNGEEDAATFAASSPFNAAKPVLVQSRAQ